MSFPAPNPEGGFTLFVNVTVKPDQVDEFLKHFYEAFEKVSAEPECLSFEVFRYQDEPNHFKWVENWGKSKEWFFEHQITKPYMKPYIEATDHLFIGEKKLEILERFGGEWARSKEGVYKQS
ncbi:hypothetical protein BDZ85DRAFT_260930 [Elsinoe ampelina]|uniref:ABM domain-containing protein n=1 Tax=Elsinoe ampelina TaxID=302913 RepID=A0A6A6GFH8_9PEZI|nr:hypothetical protein BDZ85DRAFT_260930 [Elsinoe ampelina]